MKLFILLSSVTQELRNQGVVRTFCLQNSVGKLSGIKEGHFGVVGSADSYLVGRNPDDVCPVSVFSQFYSVRTRKY